jgi:glycosyltransferase involved in cell wall biosynthesis
LSNSLGISNNVIFAGFLSDEDLMKCYVLCALYVSPSRLEGFGLTVLEAMANAKPVIATNAGAFPEILQNNENGILVPVDDTGKLAESIELFLTDTQLSKTVGEKNAEYVNKSFSWEKTAKEIDLIYVGYIGNANSQ